MKRKRSVQAFPERLGESHICTRTQMEPLRPRASVPRHPRGKAYCRELFTTKTHLSANHQPATPPQSLFDSIVRESHRLMRGKTVGSAPRRRWNGSFHLIRVRRWQVPIDRSRDISIPPPRFNLACAYYHTVQWPIVVSYDSLYLGELCNTVHSPSCFNILTLL